MGKPMIVAPPVWYICFWLGFLSLYCAYWNFHDGKDVTLTRTLIAVGIILVALALRNQLR